jgi:hypothetical protein
MMKKNVINSEWNVEVDWEKAAAEFQWDGSFREICVFDTTLTDWNKVLDFIRRLEPSPTYFEDNAAASIPHTIEPIFEKRDHVGARLDFMVGSFLLQCHFYCSQSEPDIEFILDPREMKNLDELKILVNFMRQLIILTKKHVALIHEGFKDGRIIEGFAEGDEILWKTTSWMTKDTSLS